MKHPPHDKDRCCRVCHAVVVTTPITDTDPAGIRFVEPDPDKRPPAHGDGQRSLVDHLQYDRARKRKAAGMWQLNESTGDWAGD